MRNKIYMESNLNLKSSTIEKGLAIAENFVKKLLGPTIEESGQLIADQIKYVRFKNQVSILLKAQKIMSDKDIKPGSVPLKILVPLLEGAALEDDTELQNKWANLVANLADPEVTQKNHVFPYILGQISWEEYHALEELYNTEQQFYKSSAKVSRDILAWKKKVIHGQMPTELKQRSDAQFKLNQEGFTIGVDDVEVANLVRLGLIRQLPAPIVIDEFKTGKPSHTFDGDTEEWHQLSVWYDTEEPPGSRITELGYAFIEITTVRDDNNKDV